MASFEVLPCLMLQDLPWDAPGPGALQLRKVWSLLGTGEPCALL